MKIPYFAYVKKVKPHPATKPWWGFRIHYCTINTKPDETLGVFGRTDSGLHAPWNRHKGNRA